MSGPIHLIVFLLYASAAVALAVALPVIAPGIAQGQAILFGLVVLALFAVAHEWSARRASEARTARLLMLLKRAFDEQRAELDDARREILALSGLTEDGRVLDRGAVRRAAAPSAPPQPPPSPSMRGGRAESDRGGAEAFARALREPEADDPDGDDPRAMGPMSLPSFLTEREGADPPGDDSPRPPREPRLGRATAPGNTARASGPGLGPASGPNLGGRDWPAADPGVARDPGDTPNTASAPDRGAPRGTASPGAAGEGDPTTQEVRVLHQLVEALYADGVPGRALEGLRETGTGGGFRREPVFGATRPAAMAGARAGLRVVSGEEDQRLLDIVREGLRQDRVDLYLQPIVSLPQRKRRFYECYSRIRAEDGSIITPTRYLHLAEQAGLLTAIDNMLLFRCVNLLRKLQQRDIATRFFCNISAFTLSDRAFFRDFVDYMEAHAELAPQLVLEIGQADLSRHFAQSAPDLERLKQMGYRLSLDKVEDFSALDIDNFKRLGIEFVKLPAPIILEKMVAGEAMEFRRLKQRLDAANVDLIVEKIESEQMLVELLEFSIDFGQGYLFGEPRISKDPELRGPVGRG